MKMEKKEYRDKVLLVMSVKVMTTQLLDAVMTCCKRPNKSRSR